jgi:hypothetical protein
MNTLLVALGILASFGALFWLDRYYKDTGTKIDGEGGEESDGDDRASSPESIQS